MVENTCLQIILEFVENGTLKDIIKHFGCLPEILASKYARKILKGIEYIHSQSILHRDLKCANILTTKDGQCKIADFGVAIKLKPGSDVDEEKDAAGTTYWSMFHYQYLINILIYY